jgi:hypothetical protein
MDEYCLLALICAARNTASDLAREAAAFLNVESIDFMGPLAGEMLSQMESGALVFEPPSLPEFRAMMGDGVSEEVLMEAAPDKAGRNFRT